MSLKVRSEKWKKIHNRAWWSGYIYVETEKLVELKPKKLYWRCGENGDESGDYYIPFATAKFFKQLAKDGMWFTNSDRFKSFVRVSSAKKKSKKKGRGSKKWLLKI